MIYVHVPFCRSFCTYCDFYSQIACRGKDNTLFQNYLFSLKEEIRGRRSELASTASEDTLYIGGGTPSVLPLSVLKEILDALQHPSPFAEFTIEVNPEDIVEKGEDYVRGLLSLGVNRVSMGVQSLSDPLLRWMNRRHSARGAREAFGILRDCGVKNISVDVIFGISSLSDEVLEDTVEEILQWHPEHISAYQLSVEEGSALSKMVEEGRYAEAPEEQCRGQYEYLCRSLSAAGYRHYEISNWARPGFEAVHNSAYWKRKPYVGLGPGAHSLVINTVSGEQRRCWNSEDLCGWSAECEVLSDVEIREERLMLGLRTQEGIDGMAIPEKDWFISDEIILNCICSS